MSSRVLFALVLRKYLYDAFLCGTDRVFISDHQTFSGFFEYEIVDGKRMTIDCYVINDPEWHDFKVRNSGIFLQESR